MKLVLYILFLFSFNHLIAQSDTINQTDQKLRKQGYWVIYFENTHTIQEEGEFKNDKKTGIWKRYRNNGTLQSEITYITGQPNGYAKIYYPNGSLLEEGFWTGNVWIGAYKLYYKNGNLNYKWNFSKEGLRTGKQEYYHENGQKMIEGYWENGLESGVVKQFDKNGNLILEQTFLDGKINPLLTIEYTKETHKDSLNNITKDSNNVVPLELFETTGNRKLYDQKKRLTQEGYFENGQLINGKKYYYNKNNEIIKIDTYEHGKIDQSETIH